MSHGGIKSTLGGTTTLIDPNGIHSSLLNPAPMFTDPSSLSNLTLWLDANNAGSITQSGGLVSQWNDLSASGYVFTQPAGANQPTYTASAVNGKPGILFGASTWLNHATAQLFGTSNSQALTFFVVVSGYNFSVAAFPSYLETIAPNGTASVECGFSSNASLKNAFFGSNDDSWADIKTNGFGSTDTPYALALTYNGSGSATVGNFAMYSSNVSQPLTPSGSAGLVGQTTIGSRAGANPLSGNICEMIIYFRVLNSTEMGQIETYFTGKYGL